MKLLRYIVPVFFAVSFAFAHTWNVGDSVATIQAAIDTAASGDTVLVNTSHQNVGPVEIIGKKIALLSKGYMNNPATYGIASGAALFDTLNTMPQLRISSADSTVIMGFLIDKSDIGNGGGVLVDNSNNVYFEGVHFKANSLLINNASVVLNKTQFYASDTANYDLIKAYNSRLEIKNTVIKNSDVDHLIVTGSGSELEAENLAVFNNNCAGELYQIGSSTAYFNYMTSYGNSTPANDWKFSSTWTNIRNSVLEFAPPLEIGQCEVNFSAVPGNYPGTGNLSLDPMIDSEGDYPALLATSPCISAADPDTTGIPRKDILGKPRPNPEWAPPDMGAYESERHMLLNDDHLFWISKTGHDVWGNGSNDHPFASIQTAVDYAQKADTLILLPGTYQTNAVIEDKSLTIASPYLFEKNGDYRDSVLLVPDTSMSGTVFLVRNADSVKIAGLSIKDGRGREFYNNYSFGGAIYCENTMLDLEYLKLSDNQSDYSGGAIYALKSDLYMNGVWLENNRSYFGGAVSLSDSKGYFQGVIINENLASSGGGLYLDGSSKLVAWYTQLTDNQANSGLLSSQMNKPATISQYGGAIYSIGSHIRLHNSFIKGNRAVNQGAGIALRYGALDIVQSTVVDNINSIDSVGVIYAYDPDEDVVILNSILWNRDNFELVLEGADLIADHALLYGGSAGMILKGNYNSVDLHSVIEADPSLDEDYNYSPTSPCLNAGIASYTLGNKYLINYLATEYDGAAPHIGYHGAYPDVRFDLEDVESSLTPLPEDHLLLRAYPNPFNPETTIRFLLEKGGQTHIGIYDISGKRVHDLVDRYMVNGSYALRFNAVTFPSGVYVVRMVQDNAVLASHKLLLVK